MTGEAASPELADIVMMVRERLAELVFAPLNHQDMLWTAIPLLIATLFMAFYFGRYRKEELGWNTAYGNTTVFLFVAINIVREMYANEGSWGAIFDNKFYLTIVQGLVGASAFLMFITYFHLMPKRLAFFLFSAAPINVSVYIVMAIVYANVPLDYITLLAGAVFIGLMIILSKLIGVFLWVAGLQESTKKVSVEVPETLAKKIQEFEKEEHPEKVKEKVKEIQEELVEEKELEEEEDLGELVEDQGKEEKDKEKKNNKKSKKKK